jgi:hypothetical protein
MYIWHIATGWPWQETAKLQGYIKQIYYGQNLYFSNKFFPKIISQAQHTNQSAEL